MKAKQLNEKPFWWDHLHTEAKIKSPEEIHKFLVETGISEEQLREITRDEKYLAMSQGCYIIDLKKIKEERVPQIAGTSGSLGSTQPVAIDLETPIEAPKNYPSPVPQEVLDEAAEADKELAFLESKKNNDGVSVSDEDMMGLEDKLDKEDVFGKPTSSSQTIDTSSNKIELNTGLNTGDNKPSSGVKNVAEIRKQAQAIVRSAVGQINEKADSIPDEAADMKEQELLKAVIDELNSLKEK